MSYIYFIVVQECNKNSPNIYGPWSTESNALGYVLSKVPSHFVQEDETEPGLYKIFDKNNKSLKQYFSYVFPESPTFSHNYIHDCEFLIDKVLVNDPTGVQELLEKMSERYL